MQNKYEQLDIVRKAGLDRIGARFLHSQYDPFFKVAAGLDIANEADGNVEAPCGWFALIDMRTDNSHEEVVKGVYDLVPPVSDEETPAPGFYVAQEDSNGLIFVYEFETREASVKYYHELMDSFNEWLGHEDDDADRPLRAHDYTWIAAWGAMMSSAPWYIEREQQIAAEEGAPLTTVYRDPILDARQPSAFTTLEEVLAPNTREFIQNYATNRSLTLPDSVIEAWGLDSNNKSDNKEQDSE